MRTLAFFFKPIRQCTHYDKNRIAMKETGLRPEVVGAIRVARVKEAMSGRKYMPAIQEGEVFLNNIDLP